MRAAPRGNDSIECGAVRRLGFSVRTIGAMVAATGSGPFNGFLAWWGDELAGMLPKLSRRRRATTALLIAIDGDEFRLLEPKLAKAGPETLSDGALPLPAMLDLLAARIRNRDIDGPIGIRVPPSMCLRRTVNIPRAAARDVARVLAMDLERSTPLKATDVLSGYTIVERPGQPSQLAVQHFILKRKRVEAIADAIERLGVTVGHVEVAPHEGGAALPLRAVTVAAAPASSKRSVALLNSILVALVLGLGIYAAGTTLRRHETAVADLQQANALLAAKERARKAALTKTEADLELINGSARLRAEYVARADILEELSRILPDTAWITDLRIDGTTLDISGQAKSATALLPLIETSAYFVDATLSTSVTFDPGEEMERFSIRARIRGLPTQQPATSEGARP